jgi:hypothetical protein
MKGNIRIRYKTLETDHHHFVPCQTPVPLFSRKGVGMKYFPSASNVLHWSEDVIYIYSSPNTHSHLMRRPETEENIF